MIEVKGYICEHCKRNGRVKRVYSSKTGAARHEKFCYFDPARKACAMCENCLQLERDDFGGWGGHESHNFWGQGHYCDFGYDREDAGMCNGSSLPVAPQSECNYWVAKIERNEE